ncbi:hypothetical protein Glove_166g169 [Diversispora epigaea]|uniref:Uncharacterized protein n=1 Tax=Diversispora epigaea TaxID=1348612 RepID=A0A397IWP6_9GLOM|nr:hypothetical protein Glove_166g169 [Diversispora epigaea]
MISKLEDPEELESLYFKIQSTLEPHNLVETSKRILQAVNIESTLTYSYCLEVLFEDDKAFFTLCLNPVLWFDVYLRKKDLETSARIARTYVTNIRLTVSYENNKIAPFEVEYSETVKNSAFTLCKYKKDYSDRRCDCDYSNVICKGTSKTQNEHNTVCNFYILDDFVIWEREKYYIMYRREPIRGLLFVSRPDDNEKNNFNYFDNTTLIKNQLFWQDLLKEREHLKFNLISFNYGIWETKQARSKDKYIQNYHVHVHLNFDDTGWKNLKTKISEDSNFSSLFVRYIRSMLNARNFPESNNLLKNCLELEHFRLPNSRITVDDRKFNQTCKKSG